MGAFRLLLDLAVVSDAFGTGVGLIPLHGDAVVQSFLIVSGFYMGLVLDTTCAQSTGPFMPTGSRAGPNVCRHFVVSRAHLTGQLFYFRQHKTSAEISRTADTWLVVVVVVTNLFIVGQEWADVSANTRRSPDHRDALHFYELIPQGWSIALELELHAGACPAQTIHACSLGKRRGIRRPSPIAVGDRFGLSLAYFLFPTSLVFFVGRPSVLS